MLMSKTHSEDFKQVLIWVISNVSYMPLSHINCLIQGYDWLGHLTCFYMVLPFRSRVDDFVVESLFPKVPNWSHAKGELAEQKCILLFHTSKVREA